jgi:hypothetical protein
MTRAHAPRQVGTCLQFACKGKLPAGAWSDVIVGAVGGGRSDNSCR